MKINFNPGLIRVIILSRKQKAISRRLIMITALQIMMVLPFAASGQSGRITLHMRDKPIKEIIDAVEQQSRYRFYYNSKLIDVEQAVSIVADNQEPATIIERMFRGTGIAYRINEYDVILTTPRAGTANTPERRDFTVQGLVTDKEGKPLAGATVLIVGGNTGVTTNVEGSYSVKVPDSRTKLRFTYMGYVTQEHTVGDRSYLNIIMQEDVNLMDDVVVIGYGTLEKRAVTSSITSIQGKDLVQGIGGASLATALQGKVSGMTITTTSSPNASHTFQLRGVASINASQSPLVVVDGIPGGDIRTINQEDIQSIDILKDASAGAIYGTRAAGGVILITTRQANEGPMKLTYTAEMSTEQVRRRPEVLNRQEFLRFDMGLDMGHDTDWYKELLNEGALSHRHVVNLSGGGRNARVYATFMHQDQKGISIGDNRKDYSGRINGNFSLLDNLVEIKVHSEYRQIQRDNRSSASDFRMGLQLNPTISPYDETSDTGYYVWTGGFSDFNPVADIMLKQNDIRDKWMVADATVKLNIHKDFSAQATVGYQDRSYHNVQYTSAYHKSSLDNGYDGRAYQNYQHRADLSFEMTGNYNRRFDRHNVSGVVGYSFWERNGEEFSATNYDFPVDGVGPWNMASGSFLSDGQAAMASKKTPRERLIAFFGRGNYSFDDKYILTASFRHEGSSKFGNNNKWGNFWAVSGGWRISSEMFMDNINWLDDLKLRVGYGVTGNNGFSAGKSTRMYTSNSWWIYNGAWILSYGSAHNVNNDLHWEEKSELNFGVDYSLFKNRLYGKFDVYKRKVDGMIYDITVPSPPAIYSSMSMNYGNLENKGWEFEVGGIPVQVKDFQYSTNLRMSRNRSKITSLWGSNTYQDRVSFPAPGTPGSAGRLEEGTVIGQYYIWECAGIDKNGQWLIYDRNGDIIPSDKRVYEDKKYMGNSMPKLILSWDHNFIYKNWTLGINLRSWIKYDVFNTINMYYGLSTVTNQNVLRDAFIKNRHIKQEKLLCDYWLEDGTFLKIDAVSLGYTFNMKKYQKYLDKIHLYFTVRDLACFTGYSGLDPEVDINGLDPGYEWFTDIYPRTRRFTFGIQLSF